MTQNKNVDVKMLETTTGSPDGVSSILYTEGERYNLPPKLANMFIAGGLAIKVIGNFESVPVKKEKPKPVKRNKKKVKSNG